jgi:hypothetical protein
MSLFLVTSQEVMEALEEGVEWTNRGIHVFVSPDLIPPDPSFALWLMEFTGAFELRELTVKWTRNFTGKPPEDHAMCTFHILNVTGATPDATWITSDYTTCEGLFDAWWTSIKDKYPAFGPVLAEYSWRADGPAFKPFGSSLQPTLRITPKNVPGTSTGDAMLPPQTAVTVTEVIPSTFVVPDVEGVGAQTRNRWGRFYLPAPGSTSLADGRIASATLTDFADATQTLYNALVAAEFVPVVYSPTVGHAWSVDEIHVDDVFDVVRSRRFRNTLARTPRAITEV